MRSVSRLFAVTGAQKALAYGIDPVMAAVLGMISGIGGGMVRDVLAGEVPFVLRTDLYAVAALAAGAIVALGSALGAPPAWAMLLGASFCIFLRIMALFHGWRAPRLALEPGLAAFLLYRRQKTGTD